MFGPINKEVVTNELLQVYLNNIIETHQYLKQQNVHLFDKEFIKEHLDGYVGNCENVTETLRKEFHLNKYFKEIKKSKEVELVIIGGIYNDKDGYKIVLNKKNKIIYGYHIEKKFIQNSTNTTINNYLSTLKYNVDFNDDFFAWNEIVMEQGISGYLGQINKKLLLTLQLLLLTSNFGENFH